MRITRTQANDTHHCKPAAMCVSICILYWERLGWKIYLMLTWLSLTKLQIWVTKKWKLVYKILNIAQLCWHFPHKSCVTVQTLMRENSSLSSTFLFLHSSLTTAFLASFPILCHKTIYLFRIQHQIGTGTRLWYNESYVTNCRMHGFVFIYFYFFDGWIITINVHIHYLGISKQFFCPIRVFVPK